MTGKADKKDFTATPEVTTASSGTMPENSHIRFALSARAALLGVLLWPILVAAEVPEKPNIVFILADDLGYGDLGVQGGTDVATPHIDQLARKGARFTNFYANHPICAPSRAGIITGRYQQRFGFEHNGPMRGTSNGLPPSQKTVPERLQALGYTTGMIGKWHLGYTPEHEPTARGFNTFYGTLHGAMAYVPDGASGLKKLRRGTSEAPMPHHVTEAFGDEAVAFIDKNKDRPFFLYVSFTAVHAPLQTTQDYLDRFPEVEDRERRIYLAMLAAMDDAVGDITTAIDRHGLAEKTLIIFTSDNGGPTWQTTSSNGPLNGVKALMLEGGLRVPTIIRWKGVVPEGQVLSTVGIGHDLSATSLAVAGAKLDGEIDGVSLIPHLTGEATGNVHEQLFWRMATQGAMRDGPWKLVKVAGVSYLFNLDEDLGEHNNLAAKELDRLHDMEARWKAWSDSMARPAFGRCSTVPQEQCKAPQALADLVDNYVAGRPVNPRPLLYGGGPEK